MNRENYPSWKVFLSVLFSPALGGAIIVIFGTILELFKGKFDLREFLVLLYMFSIGGWLLYLIPILVLALSSVWLKLKGNIFNYLAFSFLGGGIAHFWAAILMSSGRHTIYDESKSILSHTTFFIAGFCACFVVSYIAFPKEKA